MTILGCKEPSEDPRVPLWWARWWQTVSQTGMCLTPKGSTGKHIHSTSIIWDAKYTRAIQLPAGNHQSLPWSVKWALLKCNFQSSPALVFLQMPFVSIKCLPRLSEMSSYQWGQSKYKWQQHLASAACTGSCCCMLVASANRGAPALRAAWKRQDVRAV